MKHRIKCLTPVICPPPPPHPIPILNTLSGGGCKTVLLFIILFCVIDTILSDA